MLKLKKVLEASNKLHENAYEEIDSQLRIITNLWAIVKRETSKSDVQSSIGITRNTIKSELEHINENVTALAEFMQGKLKWMGLRG
jgi:hypothetical protein